jgi:hypothetical protein
LKPGHFWDNRAMRPTATQEGSLESDQAGKGVACELQKTGSRSGRVWSKVGLWVKLPYPGPFLSQSQSCGCSRVSEELPPMGLR